MGDSLGGFTCSPTSCTCVHLTQVENPCRFAQAETCSRSPWSTSDYLTSCMRLAQTSHDLGITGFTNFSFFIRRYWRYSPLWVPSGTNFCVIRRYWALLGLLIGLWGTIHRALHELLLKRRYWRYSPLWVPSGTNFCVIRRYWALLGLFIGLWGTIIGP